MKFVGPISDDDPVERLLLAVMRSSWSGNPREHPPSPRQISYVLHALADHTSLIQAVAFSPGEDPATSVGRWLHAYGDTIDDRLNRQ